MEGLEGAVVGFEVLGDGLGALEADLVRVQVKDLDGVVLQQVLHDDVDAIVSELVLPHGDLLQANVVLHCVCFTFKKTLQTAWLD